LTLLATIRKKEQIVAFNEVLRFFKDKRTQIFFKIKFCDNNVFEEIEELNEFLNSNKIIELEIESLNTNAIL
jgi:hypothetical protein